ncbi:hypothetical protein Avbf_11128 [Armadillidium vulgare]|nr:hypothetical protein Avbf_11128 [Armadillidium vulgare]
MSLLIIVISDVRGYPNISEVLQEYFKDPDMSSGNCFEEEHIYALIVNIRQQFINQPHNKLVHQDRRWGCPLDDGIKKDINHEHDLQNLTCQHIGYSQSMSKPSKLYFWINSRAFWLKFALAVGSLTSLLYLSPAESVHPPIEIKTFIPNRLYATTLS